MGTLLSCLCAGSQPPFDRLTLIYEAARELSGDDSLPSAICVSGVPPLARLSYIYAAFRVLAADDDLPSQECVEGEPYPDQVTRIYEAALGYAADDELESVECVRGLPIWKQWVNIYAAVYSAQGSPEELPLPDCVGPQFDILTHVYCALVAGCQTPTLTAASINGDVLTLTFSTNVTGTVNFDLVVDGNAAILTYTSGEGTNTLVFSSDVSALEGDVVTLSYTPGDVTNGDCPLEAFADFPVDNELDAFTYLRPDGVFTYLRPDGVSRYIRP